LFNTMGKFTDHDRVYFTDLLATYGAELDDASWASGRTSFTDMIMAMLPALGASGESFDLAVLSGTTPDSQPGFPLCRLSATTDHAGLVFAVSDQGVVAPFTALSMVVDIFRAGSDGRALLFVADQSTFVHSADTVKWLRPGRDSAVAMSWENRGPDAIAPYTAYASVPADLSALLEAELSRRLPAGATCTVVLGRTAAPHLATLSTSDEVLIAPAGLPCTGIWSVLARNLAGWRGKGKYVVMADYDEGQHRLSACTLSVARAGTAKPHSLMGC
jgi:hypothetical protein